MSMNPWDPCSGSAAANDLWFDMASTAPPQQFRPRRPSYVLATQLIRAGAVQQQNCRHGGSEDTAVDDLASPTSIFDVQQVCSRDRNKSMSAINVGRPTVAISVDFGTQCGRQPYGNQSSFSAASPLSIKRPLVDTAATSSITSTTHDRHYGGCSTWGNHVTPDSHGRPQTVRPDDRSGLGSRGRNNDFNSERPMTSSLLSPPPQQQHFFHHHHQHSELSRLHSAETVVAFDRLRASNENDSYNDDDAEDTDDQFLDEFNVAPAVPDRWRSVALSQRQSSPAAAVAGTATASVVPVNAILSTGDDEVLAHETAQTDDQLAAPDVADGGGINSEHDLSITRQTWRYRKNLGALSIGFLLIFTAFRSLQALETTVFAAGRIGAVTMAAVHGSMAIVCPLLAPLVVVVSSGSCFQLTGKKFICVQSWVWAKWLLVFSGFLYVGWVAANLNPKPYILLPASILAGLAQCISWAALIAYMRVLTTQRQLATPGGVASLSAGVGAERPSISTNDHCNSSTSLHVDGTGRSGSVNGNDFRRKQQQQQPTAAATKNWKRRPQRCGVDACNGDIPSGMVFVACFQMSHVWGNLLSSLMLAGTTGGGTVRMAAVYESGHARGPQEVNNYAVDRAQLNQHTNLRFTETAGSSGGGPAAAVGTNADFGVGEASRNEVIVAASANDLPGTNQDHVPAYPESAGGGISCGVYDTCELHGIKEVWTMVNTEIDLPTPVVKLMVSYLALAVLGLLVLLFLLENISLPPSSAAASATAPTDRDTTRNNTASAKSTADSSESHSSCKRESHFQVARSNLAQLYRRSSFLLLVPLLIFNGLEQGFIYADYTKSFVACNLGIDYIGYNMLTFGVSNFAFSIAVGMLARHVVPEAIVGVAAVLQLGLIVFLLVWIPSGQLTPVFFVISALWGLCDAIWQIQCNCLVSLSCPQSEHDVAFQNCRTLQGVGAALAFALSAVSTGPSCTSVKLYIMIVLLSLALLLYAVFEYRLRQTPSMTASAAAAAAAATAIRTLGCDHGVNDLVADDACANQLTTTLTTITTTTFRCDGFPNVVERRTSL